MTTLLPSSIRAPARLTPRNYMPPTGGPYPYRVQPRDNWNSLASSKGISAWSLIRYNYPDLPADLQSASREVNWYLRNYVGCVAVTPSRRNYRFVGASPGVIWLPSDPAHLTPTVHDIARDAIVRTLREPAVARILFQIDWIVVAGFQFERVAQAVAAGAIQVEEDPGVGHMAYYHGDSNKIRVGPFAGAPNVGMRALIVHECVHAIFDLRKLTISTAQREGAAYIAQAMYGVLNGTAARNIVSADPADPISQISWQLIFDESLKLARQARTNFLLSADDVAALYWAVRNANVYRSATGNTVYTGVSPAFDLDS